MSAPQHTPGPWRVVAGHEVWDRVHNEYDAVREGLSGPRERDNALCRAQERHSREGIRGAKLVESIYGWSVRADSGMQDFSILAGSRDGTLDGSWDDAERFVRAWVAEDPTRRYAWTYAKAEGGQS